MQKLINFNLETSGKKFIVVFKNVFRTQWKIYGGFSGK